MASLYNAPPLLFSNFIDECQPIDILTDWCGEYFSVLPSHHCWTKPQESCWAPFCFVDSPVAVSPRFFDVPTKTTSPISISSLHEECSISRPESISLSPSINKSSFFFQRNDESKWCFPVNQQPPIPLPGWTALP